MDEGGPAYAFPDLAVVGPPPPPPQPQWYRDTDLQKLGFDEQERAQLKERHQYFWGDPAFHSAVNAAIKTARECMEGDFRYLGYFFLRPDIRERLATGAVQVRGHTCNELISAIIYRLLQRAPYTNPENTGTIPAADVPARFAAYYKARHDALGNLLLQKAEQVRADAGLTPLTKYLQACALIQRIFGTSDCKQAPSTTDERTAQVLTSIRAMSREVLVNRETLVRKFFTDGFSRPDEELTAFINVALGCECVPPQELWLALAAYLAKTHKYDPMYCAGLAAVVSVMFTDDVQVRDKRAFAGGMSAPEGTWQMRSGRLFPHARQPVSSRIAEYEDEVRVLLEQCAECERQLRLQFLPANEDLLSEATALLGSLHGMENIPTPDTDRDKISGSLFTAYADTVCLQWKGADVANAAKLSWDLPWLDIAAPRGENILAYFAAFGTRIPTSDRVSEDDPDRLRALAGPAFDEWVPHVRHVIEACRQSVLALQTEEHVAPPPAEEGGEGATNKTHVHWHRVLGRNSQRSHRRSGRVESWTSARLLPITDPGPGFLV